MKKHGGSAPGQFGLQRLSNGTERSGLAKVPSGPVHPQARAGIRAVPGSSTVRVALEGQLH
jgi:hypothetical protein